MTVTRGCMKPAHCHAKNKIDNFVACCDSDYCNTDADFNTVPGTVQLPRHSMHQCCDSDNCHTDADFNTVQGTVQLPRHFMHQCCDCMTTATLMLISTQYQVQYSCQDIPCISVVHVRDSDYCYTDVDFTLICVQRGTDGDQNHTVSTRMILL